jgi:hypothetical protein
MTIPTRDLPRVAWRRIVRELHTRLAPRSPQTIEVGTEIEQIAARLREREWPRFFGFFPEQARLILRFFPELWSLTLDEADRIMQHRFDILGSGPTDLGNPIDWHTDFVHGHTWPVEHHTRIELTREGGGFDVKVPWELSRFHHALRLGQAHLYTGENAYAQEIVDQITDWIEANPYEFGVNWAGPMDVAIRAVNWIWAYYMIIESDALTEDFLALWLTSIRQHGEYLLGHLEDGWPRTNHLIADLAGLAYLGILFPEFPESAKWRAAGLGRLWEEIERQVHPDGMVYEASTSYHRLVTEIALSVAALALVNGIVLPAVVRARLASMLDVIMAYSQPDGTAPIIGDADDGRFHPLTIHDNPTRMANDHRHLLGLGSVILERDAPGWAGYVDAARHGWALGAGWEWQDALWFFTQDAAARYTDMITAVTSRPEGVALREWVDVQPGIRVRARALSLKPISIHDVTASRGFEASGLYVLREGDFHMTVDAGDIGQDGAGGHAHNDTLGITLTAYGRPFLIDPGSYTYTADPKARNRFRRTDAHNVLQVNESEINHVPESPFRLGDDARVRVHHWIAQPSYDLFDASHDGYARGKPGVIHRRQIWFDKTAGLWLLHDELTPASADDKGAEVDAALWFHFVQLRIHIDRLHNTVHTDASPGANLTLLPLGEFPLAAELGASWIAPRYGVRQKAPVAKFTGRVRLPADLVLMLYPHFGQIDVTAARLAGRTALMNMKQAFSPSRQRRRGLAGRG